MKARKTLEIRFPQDFTATLFLWDNGHLGFPFTREGAVVRVAVQRRTERRDIRRRAWLYGATTLTRLG